jgi:hypothetical protein
VNIPLPRFLQEHQHQREHAAALTNAVVDNSLDLRERVIVCDPSDALALRGVPCVGRGCASGVIRGTQPESAVVAKLSRD